MFTAPIPEAVAIDLAGGLRFIKVADEIPGMKFILVSDGDPDDRPGALTIAQTFKNHIDVIYVGPENNPSGRDFLYRLAQSTGGKGVTAEKAVELSATVQRLLLSEKVA